MLSYLENEFRERELIQSVRTKVSYDPAPE